MTKRRARPSSIHPVTSPDKASPLGDSSRHAQAFRAGLSLLLVTTLGAACGSRSKDELAPLPDECSELASKLGSCFHAPEMVARTKGSFPTIKRDDREGLERLRNTCAKNLADLKGDCRQ